MSARSHVKEKRVSNPGQFKSIIQRLGRGLMLPIAILPIAGLFLGVGAGINNALIAAGVTAQDAFIFGDVIKSIGDVVFANLPILFAIAIAITFTNDAGAAGLAAFVGWLVFNAIQSPMIGDVYLMDGQNVVDVSFYTGVSSALLTQNVGITSMNTSVFGAIVIGGTTAVLYNKFYKIKLPAVIGFFSGVRFIPIIVFVASAILGMFFVIIWPLISIGITAFGNAINSLPIGLNSFIFGLTERALIPFGLHHVFYTPLWYTSAGAFLDLSQISINGTAISGTFGVTEGIVTGDQSIWIWINSHGNLLTFNDVSYISHHLNEGGGLTNAFGDITWTSKAVSQNYQPAQYMQGKFTIMIFGLPAAGAAMIMAAKKENRQVAMSVIGAAAFTSLLTGITEPIEFTFLFLAPILFFGFHVLMAGISFWVLNVVGAHVGLTFSGGLIDLIIYGVLPSATGNPTMFWAIIVLGLVYIPLYYIVFYTYIVKKDVPTPGRTDEEVKMFTKADYQTKGQSSDGSSQAATSSSEELTRLEQLIIYLGGLENLKTIDACATRLRLTVEDRDKILVDQLKGMGAAGVAGKGTNVQVIFGGEADIFKTELLEVRNGSLTVSPRVAQELDKLYGEGVSEEVSPSEELTRLEQLIIYLGGLENLKTIDACATRLRLTVEDRDKILVDQLKGMGAAGVAGKGTNVQVIFGGEADIFKTELLEVRKGDIKISPRVAQELDKLYGTSVEQVEPSEADTTPTPLKADDETVSSDKKAEVLDKVESKPQEEAKVEVELIKADKVEPKEEPKVESKPQEEAKVEVEPIKADKVEEKVEPKEEPKVESKPVEISKVEQESKPEDKTVVKDFSKNKEKFEEQAKEINEEDRELASSLIKILGGKDNLVKVSSNITRISVKVNHRKDVDQDALKALSDFKDVVGNSNNFQIVWKNEVDAIVQAINELL